MQLLSFNDFLLEKENKFNPADYNKKVYFLRKTESTENLSGDPRENVRKLNKEAFNHIGNTRGEYIHIILIFLLVAIHLFVHLI